MEQPTHDDCEFCHKDTWIKFPDICYTCPDRRGYKKPKSNSDAKINIPLLIIGVIFILALIIGGYFSENKKINAVHVVADNTVIQQQIISELKINKITFKYYADNYSVLSQRQRDSLVVELNKINKAIDSLTKKVVLK